MKEKLALLKEEKLWLKVAAAVFISVFSICVLATQIGKTGYIQNTLKRLDESRNTVMEFSGATMGSSLALSALPNDFASPLANTLSDMNRYFVLILMALFVEKLIVIEGIKLVFIFGIPIVCICYILSQFGWHFFKTFAYKLLIICLSIIFVIPCSTKLVDLVGEDYLAYIEETIEEADSGATKITGEMDSTGENTSIFDRLSDAFQNAASGMSDLVSYFKNVIKKSMNSIAILLVETVALPVVVFMFFRWLLKELFSIQIPDFKMPNKKKTDGKPEEKE